jgi:anti-sigma factor RsiW
MNCKKATVLMSAAIDGELSVQEEEELMLHIAQCPECAAEFQDAKKTKIIVQERIVRFQAPQSLVDSIVKMTSVAT